MGGKVVRAKVRLDFDQAAQQARSIDLAYEDLAQEVARDGDGVSIEELRAEHERVPRRSLRQPSFVAHDGGACPHRAPCLRPGTSPASPYPASRPRLRCWTPPAPVSSPARSATRGM